MSNKKKEPEDDCFVDDLVEPLFEVGEINGEILENCKEDSKVMLLYYESDGYESKILFMDHVLFASDECKDCLGMKDDEDLKHFLRRKYNEMIDDINGQRLTDINFNLVKLSKK
jgi:hypothetical protein